MLSELSVLHKLSYAPDLKQRRITQQRDVFPIEEKCFAWVALAAVPFFFFIISVEISYTWKDIGRRTKASLRMRCKRFQSSYCTKFGARANEKIDRLGRGRSHFLDMLATQAQIKVNVMNAKLQYRRMYVYLPVCSALCHWSQASTESIFSPRTILVNF